MTARRGAPGLAMIGLAAAAWAAAPGADRAADGPTVGMTARLDQLVLPGSELEAAPIRDRGTPVVVRVAATYPHGDAFRYDLVYYGLEPGRFDLRDYLRRKDGSATADLPPIPVTIRAALPPGQIEPHRLEASGSPRLGGYRTLMAAVSAAWVAGLVGILRAGRNRRRAALAARARPITLADRLRPLVEGAVAGTLAEGQHAELERLLIGYWRRRLDLEDAEPAAALAALRRHEEAGPLLGQLETWLHRPGGGERVDVEAFLGPYRDLPAEAAPEGIEEGPVPAGRGA